MTAHVTGHCIIWPHTESTDRPCLAYSIFPPVNNESIQRNWVFRLRDLRLCHFGRVFPAFPIITKYGQIPQPKNDIAVITSVSTVLNFNELVMGYFLVKKKNCQVNEESSLTRRSPCYKLYSSYGRLS